MLINVPLTSLNKIIHNNYYRLIIGFQQFFSPKDLHEVLSTDVIPISKKYYRQL